jgi:membrane-associated phospholipid phosphatase
VLAGFAPKLFWPFIILTIWICYTRIYLGAHYPTDVLAGLVLGYFVGFGILLIVRSVRRLFAKKERMRV